MTREEFNAEFQLLNQITEGSVRTFHALSSSGAVVMAHFLAAEPDGETGAILARLDALEPERKRRVVKITNVDGSPVVVTRFILDFDSLQRWLELDPETREAAEPAPPAAPAHPAATATASGAAAAEGHPPGDAAVEREPAGGDGHGTEAVPAPEAAPEPGEFTRMFQAASVARPPEAGGGEPSPPPPTPAAGAAPGEFTRLFRSPLSEPSPSDAATPGPEPAPTPPAADTPPPAPQAKAGPGEFTRLFQSPAAGGAPPPPPRASAPPRERDSTTLPPPPAGPPAPAGAGERPRSLPDAVERLDDFADALQAAADLRPPHGRRVELPPASPSLPGLNLHTPPSPPGVPPTALPGTGAAEGQEQPRPAAAPGAHPPGIGGAAKPVKELHGYAERLKGMAGPAPSAAPPPSPPFAAPPLGGGGEYTRIISAQTPPPLPAPQPPPPAPAHPPESAATPPAATWPLVVGLVLVFALVLALVLYFVLQPAAGQ